MAGLDSRDEHHMNYSSERMLRAFILMSKVREGYRNLQRNFQPLTRANDFSEFLIVLEESMEKLQEVYPGATIEISPQQLFDPSQPPVRDIDLINKLFFVYLNHHIASRRNGGQSSAVVMSSEQVSKNTVGYPIVLSLDGESHTIGIVRIPELDQLRTRVMKLVDSHIRSLRPDFMGDFENIDRSVNDIIHDGLSNMKITYSRDKMRLLQQDALTGFYVRGIGIQVMQAYIDHYRNKNPEKSGAMLYFDLDSFKSINERYGHEGGDAVIRNVTQVLHEYIPEGSVPVRIGGDEFIVFVPNISEGEGGLIAQKVLDELSRDHFDQDIHDTLPDGATVTASIGVVGLIADGRGIDTMILLADQASKAAKNRGKTQVALSGTITETERESLYDQVRGNRVRTGNRS